METLHIATPYGSFLQFILREPEVGSNSHLKRWLLEEPCRDIDEYIASFC